MGLPWVRLDSSIYAHDKILRLMAKRGGDRAAALYMFGLAYSGDHATDGRISDVVVPMIHGTDKHAQMLVDVGLWERNGSGYVIRNWADRQELAAITEAKHRAKQTAGKKGACVKNHGPDCGCWKDDDADIAPF